MGNNIIFNFIFSFNNYNKTKHKNKEEEESVKKKCERREIMMFFIFHKSQFLIDSLTPD